MTFNERVVVHRVAPSKMNHHPRNSTGFAAKGPGGVLAFNPPPHASPARTQQVRLCFLINPGANLKSISHRCYIREVAFEWELTKETIYLPLDCLQGGPEPCTSSVHLQTSKPYIRFVVLAFSPHDASLARTQKVCASVLQGHLAHKKHPPLLGPP